MSFDFLFLIVSRLIAGNVRGQLKELFTTVMSVNEECGPFDSLFCVGNFFDKFDADWLAYKEGLLEGNYKV